MLNQLVAIELCSYLLQGSNIYKL